MSESAAPRPEPGAAIDRLRTALGSAAVLTDADLRAGHEVDWTGRWHGRAAAVVRPHDTDQVATVLRIAEACGIAVVPQGGNTGLVAGGVPIDEARDAIVLSTRALDAIDIDAATGEVIVGAGATLEAVQRIAHAHGWDTPVDLASRGSATIGGMVATNAGGKQVVRYGHIGEHVLGVEAVLADGSVVGTVPALRKDNTGYRWPGILTGSEGTLAVITRVHLRLVPVLPDRATAMLVHPDLAAATRVMAALRHALPDLVAIEVASRECMALAVEHTGLPDPCPGVRGGAYVVVETAGRAGTAATLLADLAAAVDACTTPDGDGPADVLGAAVASSEADRARLWRYRESTTEAINALGVPHKLDVTLPADRLAAFADEVVRRIQNVAPGARTFLFGHLGDGNLHVNVVGPAPEDDRVDHAVLALVAEHGGSISAEHGIGRAKRESLHLARRPDDIAAMRRLRNALDPSGTLNPGVLLPPLPDGTAP